MSFSEKRRLLSTAQRVARDLRRQVNAYGLHATPEGLSFELPRSEFEALKFSFAHIKVWGPALDDEQKVIPGKVHYSRQNWLFSKTVINRPHFLFKGYPVFEQATE